MANTKKPAMPRLEVVQRVAALPIVESGINVTGRLYTKIKESNPISRWYFILGEKTLSTGVQLAMPAITLFETPIHQLDKFLCKSLDVVEKRVPSINLPPETMITETRRFVMSRADSVKQLGTAVLDSRMTVVTATAINHALTTADKYVDKYLPPDYCDRADVDVNTDIVESESGRARAVQAVQQGVRLRKKLQRRITRQALAEAKAIREQIHVLLYVAELVVTDPVLAWQKAKELYESLSQPEPENQARPTTFEELLVLLTRETARKIVHLINYTQKNLTNDVRQGLSLLTTQVPSAAKSLYKMMPMEIAIIKLRDINGKVGSSMNNVPATARTILEQLAFFVAGNVEREKILPPSAVSHREEMSFINGVNFY